MRICLSIPGKVSVLKAGPAQFIPSLPIRFVSVRLRLVEEGVFLCKRINDKTSGISAGTYKVAVGIGCGIDTSKYAGKNYQEFSATSDGICKTDSVVAYGIINLEVNYSVKAEDGTIYDYKYVSSFTSSDFTGPCSKSKVGNVSTMNDCSYTDKIVLTSYTNAIGAKLAVNEIQEFSKVTLKNATDDINETKTRFFSSGTAELKFNNWEGSAKFYGTKTQPTWTMSDGTQETSGTYGQPITLVPVKRKNFPLEPLFRMN